MCHLLRVYSASWHVPEMKPTEDRNVLASIIGPNRMDNENGCKRSGQIHTSVQWQSGKVIHKRCRSSAFDTDHSIHVSQRFSKAS